MLPDNCVVILPPPTQPRTRRYLYRSLPLWMKHVPADKLQSYVSVLGQQQVAERHLPGRGELCRAVLGGLAQAMALPDPTQDGWATLSSTAEAIFQLLPEQIQVPSHRWGRHLNGAPQTCFLPPLPGLWGGGGVKA